MAPKEYMKWHQKMLLGASIRVSAPTGQYDPTKLINWGANRWGFKPEFGYSQRYNKWVTDAYVGVWFFTPNNDFWSRNQFYPGTRKQTQSPVTALEGHLSYDFAPRYWASLDVNFWFGGTTTLAGVSNSLSTQRDPHRRDLLRADLQAPVAEIQLQQWHLYQVRRQLPERIRRLAILMARPSKINAARCPFPVPPHRLRIACPTPRSAPGSCVIASSQVETHRAIAAREHTYAAQEIPLEFGGRPCIADHRRVSLAASSTRSRIASIPRIT